jgi:hypothetical protein
MYRFILKLRHTYKQTNELTICHKNAKPNVIKDYSSNINITAEHNGNIYGIFADSIIYGKFDTFFFVPEIMHVDTSNLLGSSICNLNNCTNDGLNIANLDLDSRFLNMCMSTAAHQTYFARMKQDSYYDLLFTKENRYHNGSYYELNYCNQTLINKICAIKLLTDSEYVDINTLESHIITNFVHIMVKHKLNVNDVKTFIAQVSIFILNILLGANPTAFINDKIINKSSVANNSVNYLDKFTSEQLQKLHKYQQQKCIIKK